MKEQDQVCAIAELDGITPYYCPANKVWCAGLTTDSFISFRPYLTSYDAIIPLIRKQPKEIILKMGEILRDTKRYPWKLEMIIHPPKQLCEALLIATGKWIE